MKKLCPVWSSPGRRGVRDTMGVAGEKKWLASMLGWPRREDSAWGEGWVDGSWPESPLDSGDPYVSLDTPCP